MSRIKTGRNRSGGGKCCFTCLIVSIVILVLFVGGLMLGANFAFNKFVSPYIGGATLTETLSLLRGLYKIDRDEIVTDEFGAEDLDAFYENLNIALFQQPYSETENYNINLEAYEALSEAQRNAMSEDERTAFLARQNYRINIRSILDAANFGDLVSGGQNNGDPSEAGELAAAEGEGDQLGDMLKQFLFDFSILSNYNEDDAEDPANSPFVTLTITGRQVAAVINEIVSVFLTGENSPLNGIEQLQGMDDDITKYIKVPQVIINYTKALEDCDTVEEYEKSVRFTATVELLLGEIVDFALSSFGDQIPQIPPVGLSLIKRIIPRALYLTAGVYPLDNTKEVYIRINSFSDAQVATMNKIVNAVVGDRLSGESEGEGESEGSASVLVDINSRVVEVFSKIKEQNIALDFVATGSGAGLELRHIEMMLSLMGLIDPEDPYNTANPGELRSVTPHMFLSAMKCLTVSYKETDSDYNQVAKNYSDSDRIAFLSAFESRFGINPGYLSGEGINILDSAVLQSLPSQISLAQNIDYTLPPEEMRIDLSDKALAALLTEAISSGIFGGNNGTATAEEGNGNMDFLSFLAFNQLVIAKLGDDITLTNPVFFAGTPEEYSVPQALQRVYEMRLVLAFSLADLMGGMGGEGEQDELIQTVFGSLGSLYISAAIYIEEISNPESGEVYSRTVGGEVYPAAFRVNKFSYENTAKVFQTISLMMTKRQAGDNPEENTPFDLTEIFGKVEEMMDTMFNTIESSLKATLRIAEGKLVLPSIYEVISGIINEKAESLEDEMSADDVYGVFKGIYDSGIEVIDTGEIPSPEAVYVIERYNVEVGDLFLTALSNNYYMKEQINTASLFNSEQIGSMFSASSLNFTGASGLYADSRHIDMLSVPMTGDAFAALLISSGQLEQLGGGAAPAGEGGDMLKKLSIINAVMRSEDGNLYIDFELIAHLKDSSPAPAEEGDGLSAEGFLPDLIYVTASVLVYSDSYSVESPRFTTVVSVNKMEEEANSNLYKLIRLLTGQNAFDTSSITSEIESAMEQAFLNIEGNINIAYHMELSESDPAFDAIKDSLNEIYGEGTCADTDVINIMVLANVFNTINKLSNKEDPLYASDYADDLALRERLQEFGRRPDKEYDPSNSTGVVYLDNLFDEGDSDAFVDDFNRFYYINQDNRITAARLLSDGGFFTSLDTDTFNFKGSDAAYPGIYYDTLPYNPITFSVRMSDKSLAELIYESSGELDPVSGERTKRISLGSNGDYAIIVQTRIFTDSGTSYLLVSLQAYLSSPAPAPGEEPSEILPEYLFVTLVMDMDLLMTDPDSLNAEDIVLYINGMTEEETKDFFARLDKMSSSMGFGMAGFNENDLKQNAVDAIKNGFDQLRNIKGVTYGEDLDGGYIRLPDFFTYIVDYCDMHDYTVDGEGSKIADLGDPTGYLTGATDPGDLAARLRVFGNHPAEAQNINSEDGISVYNDNRYQTGDEEYFFTSLTDYYYFKATPSVDDFYAGTIFSSINSTYFNFTGDLSADPGTPKRMGLYYFDGAQYKARLSDRALAAILAEKGESISSANMDVVFESLKMYLDEGSNLVFEITSRAYFTAGAGNAVPDYIYITSFTTRTEDGLGGFEYSTQLVTNSFAIATGNTINLSYNLSQLSAFGLNFNAFNTGDVSDNISNMVKTALESFTSGVNVTYKTYADSPVSKEAGEDGVGYIEFKSIYGIISDTTLDENTAAATALTMQSMIVKLHDPDIADKLIGNPKDSDATPDYSFNDPALGKVTAYTTDRYFAHMLGNMSGSGFDIECEQALFVSTNTDPTVLDFWETAYNDASSDGFSFLAGTDYIIVSGAVDFSTFFTNGDVSLFPDIAYVSLLTDADPASSFDSLYMFNMLNAEELELLFAVAKSDTADLDDIASVLQGHIDTCLNIILDNTEEATYYPSDIAYPDCVGYVKTVRDMAP